MFVDVKKAHTADSFLKMLTLSFINPGTLNTPLSFY